ncbi:hypothetical protein HFP72_00865 [Nocardiopsis sp. ARC36]
MTTATGPTAPATDRRPPGFAAALRSEWYKFWALPSNRTILVVAVALTLGITLLMAVFGDTAAMAREQEDGRYSVIFFGSTLGVWVLAALAANVVASEHRNGTVALTLAATPAAGAPSPRSWPSSRRSRSDAGSWSPWPTSPSPRRPWRRRGRPPSGSRTRACSAPCSSTSRCPRSPVPAGRVRGRRAAQRPGGLRPRDPPQHAARRGSPLLRSLVE